MTLGKRHHRERGSGIDGPSGRRMLLQGCFAMLLTAALAAATDAQQEAQRGRISGIVVDSLSGAPLAGVQVYVPGQTIGALTRQNGRFVIPNVAPGRYELRAERVGMTVVTKTVVVDAGATAEVNFALDVKALGLDEIVVTGTAGAARRREVGNSISQINPVTLPEKPVDVTDMLQATASGVEVTLGGGGAGQGSKIRLRGSKSIEMGSDPIIYIDGVRMMTGAFPVQAAKDQGNRAANVTQSPLDMVNPHDVERIEVIKGSAATTLYGTEASAGVIQIFTKRGSQGAPVWSIETQQGTMWSQRFGAGDAKYMYMDPWICTGFLKCGEYTHTAHTQMYSASVRGGAQNFQYFSSGELFDEKGNTPNDGLKRWAARSNFTYSPASELQFQLNTAYMNQDQTNTAQGNNAEGLELNVFRQTQNYFADNDPLLINRVLNQTLASGIERFTTGGAVMYTPNANLSNRFLIGYDYSNQETRNIRPFGFFAHPEGIIHVSNYQRRILTFDYVGSFSFDLMSRLRSSFSWGGQAVGDETTQVEGYGTGIEGAEEPTLESATTALGYEERSKVWNAGFFLQNIFDLRNRYFLTLGLRVDGNSAFGSGFGLQAYPKVSGSWVVSDEGFWKESFGEVKLRVAYGQSGRAPGAFDAVRTWTKTPLKGEPAFSPENVGNPDLGPEVTAEIEGGVDGSWLDNRLRATFTYYRQRTKDALIELDQMPSLGFTQAQLTNVGEIENKGVELSVEASPFRSKTWGVDLGLNLTTNYSKVLSHVDPEDVDRPIAYSLHTLIRHPNAIPCASGTSPSAAAPCMPTALQLRVCNDDPTAGSAYTAPGVPCRMTNQFRGPNLPTTFLSGYTTFRLPLDISLSVRGEYRGGHYTTGINPIAIARSVRSPVCEPYYANEENVQLRAETPALWVARCTPAIASAGGGGGYSSKADYFKLRSISATFPIDFAFPQRVQDATLTITMNNVWTWSRESLFGTYGFENFGNEGIVDEDASTGISSNERIPAPTTLRAALRITF